MLNERSKLNRADRRVSVSETIRFLDGIETLGAPRDKSVHTAYPGKNFVLPAAHCKEARFLNEGARIIVCRNASRTLLLETALKRLDGRN